MVVEYKDGTRDSQAVMVDEYTDCAVYSSSDGRFNLFKVGVYVM